MLKHCPTCAQDLPLTAFSKDRSKSDGYCRYCRRCRKTRRKNPRFRRLSLPADYEGSVCCQKCEQSKSASEFYITRTGKLGSFCTHCLARVRQTWNAGHPGMGARYSSRWRHDNPEKQQAAQLAWRMRHPSKAKAATIRWRAAHPTNVATHKATRYARLRQAAIRESISLVILYKRDRSLCGICHQHVAWDEATRDHIIPLSKGGDHSYANVVLAHNRCNARKGNRTVLQQMRLF